MKKTICKYKKITTAIVMGVALNHVQLAMAGWTGAMNGTGLGKASVNVLGFQGDKPKSLTTTNMMNPSVAMTNTSGYVFGTALPKEASSATVAKVRGFPAYVWDATTVGSNGDSTDSTEFPGVQINPADCASLEMISSSVIAPDDKSGTITVQAIATAGTGLRVRGYEALGTLPEDDPNTEADETLDFLKANGLLKWDITLLGPFNLNSSNCTALTIPFTVATSASNNLYFVTDGVAKSLPLIIVCPNNVVTNCTDPVVYPAVQYAGCGNMTLSFDPPAGTSFPVGATPVKVTVTDANGNTTNCTFTVTITDTMKPVIAATGTPDNGVLGFNPTADQIEAALGTATATDNCGSVTPTPQDGAVSANGCLRTQTRTWTVTDAGGNQATPVSRTATWTVDTAKPVITATGTPGNGVLGFNPTADQINAALGTATATDNCGSVTPTPQAGAVSTNGCLRTQTRTWTVTDAGGNQATPVSRTATWTVDTTPPAIPVLATVTGSCGTSVTLPVPTTTDGCGGTVTVSPNVVQTFTNAGINRVLWTFTDAANNSSSAYQTGIVASLTFQGFYSPVGTVNNTISTAVTRTAGASFPLKWDLFCGTNQITGGLLPTVTIQKVSPQVGPVISLPAEFQNDWHINWPTPSATKNDIYKATVITSNQTNAVLFVKFK